MRTIRGSVLFLLLATSTGLGQSMGENQILAKVNWAIITRRDVERELGAYLEALRKDELKSDKERAQEYRRLLISKTREMVYEELTRQLGADAGITVPTSYVEQRIREEAEQVEGLPRLVQILGDQGMTLDEFRAAMESDYVVRQVLLSQAGLRPNKDIKLPPLDTYVGPRQIYAYYQSHAEEFRTDAAVKASMILIRGRSGEERRMAREEAEQVHRRALAGESFAELARKHSDNRTAENGGKLSDGGWAARGDQLKKEFEDVVWMLPRGGISDVVESRAGYYIFRVDDRRPARVAPYAEVQGRIRAGMQNRRLEENIRRIQKRLLEKAYVWPEALFREP